MEELYVFRFYMEKIFAPGNGGREAGAGTTLPLCPNFPYGPEVIYNFSIKSGHSEDF